MKRILFENVWHPSNRKQRLIPALPKVNMELEQEDGNSIPLEAGTPTFLGRELGLGSSSSDRYVSRHQVSLQLLDTRGDKLDTNDQAEEFLLSFEVVGKNPILVCSKDEEGKNRVYRKSEKGALKSGDRISLSIKNPKFFSVRRREGRRGEVESSVLDALARRERRTRQRRKEAEERDKFEEVVWEGSGLEISSLDVSEIDPVKEFGFLVRGHEFDHYPRRKIRPFKDWSWFLENPRDVSNEDDEAFGTSLKGKHQKKKKGADKDDEDWAGESEDVNTLAEKLGSAKRPRYSTRSKEPKKSHTNIQDSKKPVKKGFNGQLKELDNEDDDTLGGFIVGDEDIEEEDDEVLEEVTEEEEEEGDDEESDVD